MTELPAAVMRMIDATNAGDRDAFLAAFAPDASLVDWGKEFTGSEAIAAWNESDNIGRGSRFRVVGAREESGSWVATIEVSGGGFNGTSDLTFAVSDDLITRLDIAP